MAVMKPQEILREIAYPFTDLAVLFAMVGFFLLGKFAASGGLLGLWLGLILVPPFFRYLLYILEARAANREVPPLAVELFGWAENFWSLFPLVLLALIFWGGFLLTQHFPQFVAMAYACVLAIVFPASMAVLGITRTPSQSLNPIALLRMIRLCGMNYLLIFLIIGSVVAFQATIVAGLLPPFVADALALYIVFLLFTFIGAVVRETGASTMISIPDPVERTPDEVVAMTDIERTRILNHAYGFISRNDRTGGLAHIQTYVDASPNPASDYQWFLNAMFEWEEKDHALFFAQRYLSHLLDINAQIDAMKLLVRCRLENPEFRPLPQDRERALDIARRLQHEDLEKYLSSF